MSASDGGGLSTAANGGPPDAPSAQLPDGALPRPADLTVDALQAVLFAERRPCNGHRELFFAPYTDDDFKLSLARSLCAMCPVREYCLELGLRLSGTNGNDGGVWGGTTPKMRRAIRRAPRKQR